MGPNRKFRQSHIICFHKGMYLHSIHRGFHSHGDTLSHHPLLDGIPSQKPTSYGGTPMTVETPIVPSNIIPYINPYYEPLLTIMNHY